MENIEVFLDKVDSWVWGPPLLILLMGTGLFLTINLRCLQVTKLPKAISYIFLKEEGQGDVSGFGALCTALAATIGTGNIVGVATALKTGGPGALFWMWIAAFLGMATKYSEGLLAIKYRTVDEKGQMCGGPMYYIKNGLGLKWLAWLFAFFGVMVAFFGIGTFPQVNSITESMELAFNIPRTVTGIIIIVAVAMVTLGGIKSISRVSEIIVPFMAIFYIIGSLVVVFINIEKLPGAISLIFKSAFNPTAAIGGFAGASVMMAIRNGVARGVFSNESGLGSAPIAAAAAKTNSCVRQGLVSMTGTFFDTIIVCALTGIVIVMSGEWQSDLSGVSLTSAAFSMGLPTVGPYIVYIGLIFFAFTTILGWNYYGEKCCEYITGVKGILPYRIIFIFLVFVGVMTSVKNIEINILWIMADIVNALMAIPNLIGLLGLSSVIFMETRKYFKDLK